MWKHTTLLSIRGDETPMYLCIYYPQTYPDSRPTLANTSVYSLKKTCTQGQARTAKQSPAREDSKTVGCVSRSTTPMSQAGNWGGGGATYVSTVAVKKGIKHGGESRAAHQIAVTYKGPRISAAIPLYPPRALTSSGDTTLLRGKVLREKTKTPKASHALAPVGFRFTALLLHTL